MSESNGNGTGTGEKSRKAYTCRECGTPSKDVPTLTLPARSVPAPAQICIDCIDTLKKGSHQSLRDFIKDYIDAHTDPLKLAQARIKELEERLARAQKTIENLNPSHR